MHLGFRIPDARASFLSYPTTTLFPHCRKFVDGICNIAFLALDLRLYTIQLDSCRYVDTT